MFSIKFLVLNANAKELDKMTLWQSRHYLTQMEQALVILMQNSILKGNRHGAKHFRDVEAIPKGI